MVKTDKTLRHRIAYAWRYKTAPIERFGAAILLVLLALILIGSLGGCVGGLKRDRLVKAPDAPMLIQEVNGGTIKVSVYDAGENRLVEFGDVRLDDRHEGWTVSKFDWEAFIRSREDQ